MEAAYTCVEDGRGFFPASLDRLRPHPAFDQGSPEAYRRPSTSPFAGVLDVLRSASRHRRKKEECGERAPVTVVLPPRDLPSDTYLYLVFSALFPEEMGVLVDVRDIRGALEVRKQELTDAVPRLESDPGARQKLLRCFREDDTDDRMSDTPVAASFVSKYVHEASGGTTIIVDDATFLSRGSGSGTTFLRLPRTTRHDGKRRYSMHVVAT